MIGLPDYNCHNERRAGCHMHARASFELGDGTRSAVEDGTRAQLPVLAPPPRHDAQGAVISGKDGGKMLAACNELDASVAGGKRDRCAL